MAAVLGFLHLSLAAVPVVQVWTYKLLVDGLAPAARPSQHPVRLWWVAALYLGALLLSQAGAMLMRPLTDQTNERLQGRMRLALLEIGQRQTGLAFYQDAGVQNDLETAQRSLNEPLLEAISLVPETLQKLTTAVTLAVILGRLHPLLPLLLVGSALPRIRHESAMSRYIWSGMVARSPDYRWLKYCTGILLGVGSAKEVRLFGLGRFFLTSYERRFNHAHSELVKMRRLQQRGTTLYALTNAAVTGGAFVWIVLRAAGGQLTIGDVALYTSATYQLSGTLSTLARYVGGLSRHEARVQAYFALLDRPPALPSAAEEPARAMARAVHGDHVHPAGSSGWQDRLPGSPRPPAIEFRDVWFQYPDSASPTLRGINLRIAPGEKIAVVGENGAGKTTLLSLIGRLYEPNDGEVLIDGKPLRSLHLREWRERVATISQDFLRLDASLRANMALGNLPSMGNDAALWAACQQVGLQELVRGLPHGLDQMLGRRFREGVELSGGEWQKVAIARILLRERACVVILDEPTSALDAPTEAAVFGQFVHLGAHRTTILVSHRFSTVHMADRILVLDEGAVLEAGSHPELMQRGGKYARLFNLQASQYR